MCKSERLLLCRSGELKEEKHYSLHRLQLLSAVMLFLLTAWSPAIAVSENFDSVYAKANANYRQGNFKEALKLYKKANSLNKNSSECLFLLARTYTKLGDHRNALKISDELIQSSRPDQAQLAKAWNLRGNTLFDAAMDDRQGTYEIKLREAESALREALKINPNLNLAHYNLGIALIRMNRMDEGLSELRAYLSNATEPDIAEKARKFVEASKIPTPVLAVAGNNKQDLSKGDGYAMTLQVKNWASFPVALFKSAKDLPPCSAGNSRLEITVFSNFMSYAPPMCNITQPEGLQNIPVPNEFSGRTGWGEAKPKEVFIRIKDRLTGYTVFSQPIALP